MTNYSTLENDKAVKINIMKSIFIATAKEVNSHQQALDFLSTIKSKYPDANHHCWAYLIDNNFMTDDDDEPFGTAGTPMLNVLKRNKLNNTIVVVIRYFGGKKLGVSGLIAAYREVVEKLIATSTIVNRKPGNIFDITCDYNYANKLTANKDARQKLLAQIYTEVVQVKIFVELEVVQEYEEDFKRNNIRVNSKIESIN